MDLISRQAAIDALGDEPEVWTGEDEYAQGLNNQWTYDRNAIKHVPSAQAEQKWIPCSERLPEDEEKEYWVCVNTGYQCQCRWTNNKYGILRSFEWGWNLLDIPQHTSVIAWRSLPKPYKAEEQKIGRQDALGAMR